MIFDEWCFSNFFHGKYCDRNERISQHVVEPSRTAALLLQALYSGQNKSSVSHFINNMVAVLNALIIKAFSTATMLMWPDF